MIYDLESFLAMRVYNVMFVCIWKKGCTICEKYSKKKNSHEGYLKLHSPACTDDCLFVEYVPKDFLRLLIETALYMQQGNFHC